jgi:hypothetical protein
MGFLERWRPRRRLAGVALGLALVSLIGLVPWVADAQGASAVVRFGRPDTGSPFPPPTFDHDQSSNARDNMVPRTVIIPRNGSVFFDVEGRHQPMVYRPGTTPSQITVPTVPPTGAIPINDFGTHFVAGAPALLPGAAGVGKDWPTPVGTFSDAGRYLVICNIRPHFADFNMYGWVIVQ